MVRAQKKRHGAQRERRMKSRRMRSRPGGTLGGINDGISYASRARAGSRHISTWIILVAACLIGIAFAAYLHNKAPDAFCIGSKECPGLPTTLGPVCDDELCVDADCDVCATNTTQARTQPGYER